MELAEETGARSDSSPNSTATGYASGHVCSPPLDARTHGTRSAVRPQTKTAGRQTFSGHGVGGQETASAVLADIGRLER